jgi:hypothetical protein
MDGLVYPSLPQVDLHEHYKVSIAVLFYNLTRKDSPCVELDPFFDDLLGSLKRSIRSHFDEYIGYLKLLYRLLGQTRDCFSGKGEHDLVYQMIYVWYKHYPTLAIYFIHRLVQPSDLHGTTCYGSWRDMKYLCDTVRKISPLGIHHPIISVCVEFINQTLKRDISIWNQALYSYLKSVYECSTEEEVKLLQMPVARDHVSLVCKWIPRENKKFDWLYDKLVIHWYSKQENSILYTAKTMESYYAALDKCKMNYRKMVSFFNRALDTVETKMCARQWMEIQPSCVPQIAMMKYKKKWLSSPDPSGTNPWKQFFDSKYFSKEPYAGPSVVGTIGLCNSVPLSHYVREAFRLVTKRNAMVNGECSGSTTVGSMAVDFEPVEYQIQVLNKQWKQMSDILDETQLSSFVPMVDMSLYNSDRETLYSSIGLACLIAERSSFGKRIIIIDHEPTWIILDDCDDFVSMVSNIIRDTKYECATNSNVLACFEMLLSAFHETEISYSLLRKMVCVVLSPVVVCHADIVRLFYYGGSVCPRILYWNISRSWNPHLPCSIHATNGFVISGLSSSLIHDLRLFCKKKGGNIGTGFDFISSVLVNSRYDDLDDYICRIIDV